MTAFKRRQENFTTGTVMDQCSNCLSRHRCLQWEKLRRSKLILAIEVQQAQQVCLEARVQIQLEMGLTEILLKEQLIPWVPSSSPRSQAASPPSLSRKLRSLLSRVENDHSWLELEESHLKTGE